MPRIIEDYQVISQSGTGYLTQQIIILSKKGYELCGGHVLNSESKYEKYSQAMVKYKEEKKDNIKL